MKIQLLPKYLILSTILGICLAGCKANQKMKRTEPQQETTEQPASKTPTQPTQEEEEPRTNQPAANKGPKTLEGQLHDYFYAIANASSTDAANKSITDALSLFTNPNIPVLIIFYKADGKESYDEPTTIVKYLNYLKDTKNNKATVEEMVKDSNGRIKELVLRK
jgi:hypothetical protein